MKHSLGRVLVCARLQLGGNVAEGDVEGGHRVEASVELRALALHLAEGRAPEGAEGHGEDHLLALVAALDRDLDLVVGLEGLHRLAQIPRPRHLGTVDGDDHVAEQRLLPLPLPLDAHHAGRGARRPGGHLEHDSTLLDDGDAALGRLSFRGEPLEVRDAQHGALHLPELDQLLDDGLGRVDGDGEGDTRAGPSAERGSVDADKLAVTVDERPPRVARVDRGVGLDHPVDLAAGGGHDLPVLAADNTGRERRLLPKGVADGHSELSHAKLVRGADRQSLQDPLGRVDLQHGDVLVGVDAGELGVISLLVAVIVGEGDLGLVDLVDDVKVCDDVALSVPYEARPDALGELGGVDVVGEADGGIVGRDEAHRRQRLVKNVDHHVLHGEPGRGALGLAGGEGEASEGQQAQHPERLAPRHAGLVHVVGLHRERRHRATARRGSSEDGVCVHYRRGGGGRDEARGHEG
mmetsp:Transcript_10629/g.21039  ORF Transcript_10629/g.21039 Transcript_10629/m.21039 type:complete len:464 (-) Transcript_10629:106-1497(-)